MTLRTYLRRRPSAGQLAGIAPSARLRLTRLEDRVVPTVTIAVNAAANQHAISPLIYGVAFGSTAQLQGLNATYNRSGGNNESTYNWQTNALNLDSDWYFESYPQSGTGSAAASNQFISSTLAAGAAPTITVPTIGYLAKLGPGGAILPSFPATIYPNQTAFDPYDSNAGNGETSSGPITGNDPSLAYVTSSPATEQGWIQEILNSFGAPNAGGVQYFTLDNEPSIWFQTHRDIAPNGLSMAGELNDIITYSAMIKSVDPNAQIVGPEEWGWDGYFYSGEDQQYGSETGNWSSLPDQTAHGGAYYLPWVLSQLHAYDQAHGTQSLNVFSLHYYPQENGVGGNSVSQATELLRNASTRSLWDPTYVDPSWIGTTGINNGIVQLIPMMQNWVNTYYPGLKTDISEYDFGADGDMNGATAEADALGIFGRQGLDMANHWTTPATGSPTYMAMQMYRNYDGHDSTFGQTSVQDTVPNPDQVSSFAALRADGSLTVMVINKNLYSASSPTTPITLNLSGFAPGGAAQVWQLAATNPSNQQVSAISHLSNVNFASNSTTFNAPDESVTLFVIPAATTMTALTSSANPAAFANPITFTATVGAGALTPTGSVTFMDGTTALGTATLSGGVGAYTSSALALGSHSITAIYAGATGFAGSTSAAVTQVVGAVTTVSSVQVNDGSAQRSEVRSITVTFSGLVNFAGSGTLNQDAAAAFELTHVQDSTNINNLAAVVSTVSGQTVVTLSFTTTGNAALEIDPVSAENGGAASLADGRYQLTILSTDVNGANGLALDGDANGSPGGNYVSPTDTLGGGAGELGLYRLFGDATGNGIVDSLDLGQFRTTYNAGVGSSLYLAYMDADNSGFVDSQDLGQFRSRYNTNVFTTSGGGNDAPSPTPPVAPTVSSVEVNDGSAQRSEVRSITISFSQPVAFAGGVANAASAFQLTHLTDGNNVALAANVSADNQGRTIVTLTFSGAETDALSALNGGAPSLADGRYQLTILSGSVIGTNGQDLNGGSANGNYVSPTDTSGGGPGQLHLFRLFGDANGDGVVDAQDLGLFRSSYNAGIGNPSYLAYLDDDNSGVVDAQDLGEFRSRLNVSIYE